MGPSLLFCPANVAWFLRLSKLLGRRWSCSSWDLVCFPQMPLTFCLLSSEGDQEHMTTVPRKLWPRRVWRFLFATHLFSFSPKRAGMKWARSMLPGSSVSLLGPSRAPVSFPSTNLVFKERQDVCGLGQRPDGTGHTGL